MRRLGNARETIHGKLRAAKLFQARDQQFNEYIVRVSVGCFEHIALLRRNAMLQLVERAKTDRVSYALGPRNITVSGGNGQIV